MVADCGTRDVHSRESCPHSGQWGFRDRFARMRLCGMPSKPISSMMTLVIPLFFALAVLTAPPVAAGGLGPPAQVATVVVGGVPQDLPSVRVECARLVCEREWLTWPHAAGRPLATCPGVLCGMVQPTSIRAEGEPAPPGVGASLTACTGSSCGFVRPAPVLVTGDGAPHNTAGALATCTGSFCGLVRPAPLRVTGDEAAHERGSGVGLLAISPLDPEFCEYVGPALFFMSPSDSEFCGLVSPAPLALPSAATD
ncbi:hypothetical protein NONI108955_05125 [Nocardia ninae]